MKILVVGYYYSWSSSVGSRRVRGVVNGLVADGHEVVVIAARPANGLHLPDDIGARVLVTAHCDRVLSAKAFLGRMRRRGQQTSSGQHVPTRPSAPAFRWAHRAVRRWVSFPDSMWEWTYQAQRAVRTSGFKPDVILATAPPMAALHAAAKLAQRLGCPWIADVRDLWTGDPYRQIPPSMRRLDRRLEHNVLSSAAAITTVAETFTTNLSARHPGVPTVTLRNGFAAAWLREGDDPPAAPATIVFTGTLTAATGRNLAPVCDALAELIAAGIATPAVEIIGLVDRQVREMVAARGLSDHITFCGVVAGDDARSAQRAACGLLNFAWENPLDASSLPAKLFEYAAARRPIVHLGKVHTLGTHLIRDHHLGFIVDPDDTPAVAALLHALATGATQWIAPTAEALAPLSQQAMVEGFGRVIDEVAGRPQPTG